MRILFYLPVITDRHFEAVVLPLLRILADAAEVHVAGPPQWCMTGLTEHQLMLCNDLPEMHWHILDDEDHPLLRTAPADPQALIDLVAGIAPDYTFCRSADVATPSRFPGRTRFLMEPIIPPFALRADVHGSLMLDGPRLYDQGFMPALDPEARARLDRLFAPAWTRLQARLAGDEGTREAWLAEAGLPADKRIIALPLNVEAATNFFIRQHSATPSNARLIEQLAGQLDEDSVLALTRHPLNLHGDPELDRSVEPIEPVVERLGDKVRIVDAPGPAGNATTSLVRHCDATIICDSKSFGHAVFFSKPILRISHYASAPWMQAYTDLAAFQVDLRAGTARAPIADEARTWFAYHYANRLFAAHDPALTAAEIIDRTDREVNPDRWEAGLARLAD
ncbi:MAG: hypothetical protein ACXWU2_12455 [Allosphingosinicella sp.]